MAGDDPERKSAYEKLSVIEYFILLDKKIADSYKSARAAH